MDDIEQTAVTFDAACRAAGVQYAFIGGMAVIAWGQPRFTSDIDTLLRLEAEQDEAFVRELRQRGLSVDPRDLADSRDDLSHVTVFDERSGFHLDLKFARSSDEVEQVKAAREVDLGSGRLRIAAPEETIAFKLSFGSPQDLQDARSILWRQADDLDLLRLRRFAVRLGVADALERLLEESAPET